MNKKSTNNFQTPQKQEYPQPRHRDNSSITPSVQYASSNNKSLRSASPAIVTIINLTLCFSYNCTKCRRTKTTHFTYCRICY